ncbi:BadM/Rrf2 family transcriptional regulator [Thermosporothrix hazakensis]|jgi:Rrf2 family nitric oxide-sensitive transcriptional repressor|uniref:BadM/Rrf2 family transcriptional regulator n=1 Tax=Thermosporothrix hazakensis TaxID=644383 RepID=A0A326U403_THEHA|nr:Rrf2 family transcriptional regulator [Thermosporothrix hazakensis]PZW27373.1 BadM/Rrf2 family transcriptional regulator [Thermosporothrix hazakensis]GCE45542.1 HTH-type transcriptional regulator NsrR [Thermosporothrix hazakensis]
MRLTYQTDYALRTLLYLSCLPEGKLANIQEIATVYAISQNHLMKIVHKLGKLEYIETIRGHKGGLRLKKKPEEINIGALVRMTEEDFYIVECFHQQTNRCLLSPVCQLRGVFQEAMAAFFRVLDNYTLADLIQDREMYEQLFEQKLIEIS